MPSMVDLIPGLNIILAGPRAGLVEVPEGLAAAGQPFLSQLVTMSLSKGPHQAGLIPVRARRERGGARSEAEVIGFTVEPSTFRVRMRACWLALAFLKLEASDLLAALVGATLDGLRLACLLARLFLALLARLARPAAPIDADPDPLPLPHVLAPGGQLATFAPLC